MIDKAWMDDMSDKIVKVTKGFDKSDRRYAYDFLRKHIVIDNIHQQAIRKFRGKTIEFGTGSLNPIVVVVTKDPITKEQKERLNQAWNRLSIPTDEVYYAHLRFVKTKQKQDIRLNIFNELLDALSPQFLLAFDGVPITYDGAQHAMNHPIDIVTDPNCKDERREMMKALKQMD